MMLGLALSLCSQRPAGSAGPPPLDPTTLALASYYKGSYGGMPWAGTASAGGSGSKSLAALGVAPGVGAAQGGLTPATFNGTTQAATDGTNTTETYMTSTAYRFLLLVYIPAGSLEAVTDPGTPYADPGLFTESGGNFGIVITADGVCVYHGTTTRVATAAIPDDDAWHLVDISFDGATVTITIDGVFGDDGASAGTGSVTGSGIRIGANYDNTNRFTGRILDVATALTALAGTSSADWITYVNDEYSLSL